MVCAVGASDVVYVPHTPLRRALSLMRRAHGESVCELRLAGNPVARLRVLGASTGADGALAVSTPAGEVTLSDGGAAFRGRPVASVLVTLRTPRDADRRRFHWEGGAPAAYDDDGCDEESVRLTFSAPS